MLLVGPSSLTSRTSKRRCFSDSRSDSITGSILEVGGLGSRISAETESLSSCVPIGCCFDFRLLFSHLKSLDEQAPQLRTFKFDSYLGELLLGVIVAWATQF